MLNQSQNKSRRNIPTSIADRLYRMKQVLIHRILDKVPSSASVQGTMDMFIASIGGKDDDLSLWPLSANTFSSLDPIHSSAQLQIHQDNVGPQFAIAQNSLISA